MVDTAIKVIFSDEIIERLIDLVMEAQQKENTRLPVLKDSSGTQRSGWQTFWKPLNRAS